MLPVKKLRIFRVKDGVRVPYTMELDHELTVVAEYADMTDMDHVTTGRQQHNPRVADHPARRIATAMARWASRNVEENPLPGSENLREQFFLEKAEMERLAAQGGRTCEGCEVGKLMRRYREKLEKAGYLDFLK